MARETINTQPGKGFFLISLDQTGETSEVLITGETHCWAMTAHAAHQLIAIQRTPFDLLLRDDVLLEIGLDGNHTLGVVRLLPLCIVLRMAALASAGFEFQRIGHRL